MKDLTFPGLSQPQLEALGRRLAPLLFPGAFLALTGGLGAGKTTFTRAVAEGLGISGILSPTFTILREHRGGRLPLFHFDAYRLRCGEELYDIGFEDYLGQGGVIVMEWCENVPDALPPQRLELRLEGSGELPRNLRFKAFGASYEGILEKLK